MRLIDADAVAEVLNDEITYAKQISASSQTIMGLKMGLAYINTAEPVDAVPARHGKWIDKSGGIEGAWNCCSVCGERAIELYDYCPNCGAKMDEAEP